MVSCLAKTCFDGKPTLSVPAYIYVPHSIHTYLFPYVPHSVCAHMHERPTFLISTLNIHERETCLTYFSLYRIFVHPPPPPPLIQIQDTCFLNFFCRITRTPPPTPPPPTPTPPAVAPSVHIIIPHSSSSSSSRCGFRVSLTRGVGDGWVGSDSIPN